MGIVAMLRLLRPSEIAALLGSFSRPLGLGKGGSYDGMPKRNLLCQGKSYTVSTLQNHMGTTCTASHWATMRGVCSTQSHMPRLKFYGTKALFAEATI